MPLFILIRRLKVSVCNFLTEVFDELMKGGQKVINISLSEKPSAVYFRLYTAMTKEIGYKSYFASSLINLNSSGIS